MIKIDLRPDVIDFISSTGHVSRPKGVTHMCANPYWYKYIGGNEWQVLSVDDIPSDIRAEYIKFLEDFLKQLKDGFHEPAATIIINGNN
jgi:hypothetical protein